MVKKLKIDVKSHILVPKHTILNSKDKKQLLKRLDITIRELPKISIKDPAIQSLQVVAGDIIKIERPSPTAGKAVYYRGVTNE